MEDLMPIVPELIIYVWLLPVAVQILLPLGMLSVWLLNRIVGKKSSFKQNNVETLSVLTPKEAM